MDACQKHIIEQKEPGIKEYIIQDSVYTQVKNKQN